MSNRHQLREALIEAIITQITREIGAVLEPSEISDEVREEIKQDLVASTERVLEALTLDELQSSRACERYLWSCAQDARIEINRRQYKSKKESTIGVRQ